MQSWLLLLNNHLNRIYTRGGRWLALRLRHYFYLYLAVVLSLLVVLDATTWHKLFDARQSNFDALVKHRLIKAKPDPDIVILDINEASLSKLANDLGRWPWPRAALSDVLSKVEAQQPKAIVFDILFSEPDVLNPDSDAAFDAFLSQCSICYLPWVRLDPAQDALSALKSTQIPGALKQDGSEATVAAILPYFPAALASNRLGFNNANPDKDGILRQYGVYEDIGAARLLSLPARVVQAGKPNADNVPSSFLINWRGQPFTYPFITFADVYSDLLSEAPKRPHDEFKNKIVIIGSTAPSLFDYRASPVAEQFPGVEIIATTVDNLKNDDYYRIPPLRWAYILLALSLIWATAYSFYRHASPEKLMRWFGFSQIVLVLISYISINVSHYYINLLGPVSFSIFYFTLAKIYAFATRRSLENSVWMASQQVSNSEEQRAELVWIQLLDDENDPMPDALLQKLLLSLKTIIPSDSHLLNALQNGPWRMLEGGLLLTRLEPINTEPLSIDAIRTHLQNWLQQHQLSRFQIKQCALQTQTLKLPQNHLELWQRLLAQALLSRA